MGDDEKRPISPMKLMHVAFIESQAFRIFITNFLMAYNIRAGIAVLLRLMMLLVKRPKDLFSISKFLGETHLTFRIEAVRIGLFIGGFSGLYTALTHTLARVSGARVGWHSLVGGWIAGWTLSFMDPSWHRTLALYMSTRTLQCMYNFAKTNGYWHFWGSSWQHGDSLLFMASSAQIMYAYVMRPETLPSSYYKFIVRQGPIDETILKAVRSNIRGKPIDVQAVNNFLGKAGGQEAVHACKSFLTTDMPLLIPARALHPKTSNGLVSSLGAFLGVAKQIFPVYLSLALVPAVVLRFRQFVQSPLSTLLGSAIGALQSTAFLSSFCGGYMLFIDLQRLVLEKFRLRDHKFWYYIAAVFSGFSILIERKNRRSELALYAFPRAVDSIFLILNDHRLAFRVPLGENILFAFSMSVIMWFYEKDINNLSPLVAKLLHRFIPLKSLHRNFNKVQEDDSSDSEEMAGDQSSKSSLRHSVSVMSLSGDSVLVP